MYLVLCDSRDANGPWIQAGLLDRGLKEVLLVTADDLAHAGYDQRVGREGARLRLRLPSGFLVHGSDVEGVVNRLHFVPAGATTFIQASDRNYVVNELSAFYMSWIWSLGDRVFNAPSAQGLAGRIRHISEWVWLAGQAGIPTAPYHECSASLPPDTAVYACLPASEEPRQQVVVIGDTAFGPTCGDVRDACVRLAELGGVGMLGIELSPTPGGCGRFAGATTLPDLRAAGDLALDALARLLTGAPRA